jgi:hypothetical protein
LRNPILRLSLIAAAAVLVHGYHQGVDDAEIYIPGIKKAADPSLYPFGAEFFQSHAHLSFFPDLVGGIARLTRLPSDLVIFGCHLLGVYLLLLAAWRLTSACFTSGPARWGAVGLLAAVFSVPVAGTALAIMDPYVTARSLSAPATLFAVSEFVSSRLKRSLAWLLFAAIVHPQMSIYGAVLLGCLALMRRPAAKPAAEPALVAFAGLPFLWSFQPAQGAAREALLSRTYFFVSNWAWYEWVGAAAPVALLWWFAGMTPKGTTPAFRWLARSLVPFALLFTVAGLVLTFSAPLENYTRLQPMRVFHILYLVFFVLLGGLLGEYVLRRRPWRWLVLFTALAGGMYGVARASYPFSPQVELPGRATQNNWADAFLWVRHNTPKDAVFALDPNYMAVDSDDQHGFRAIAERSALADNVKDSGAVSLFPQLAKTWKEQVLAQTCWKEFRLRDFQKLAQSYPVTWIVTQRPLPAGLECAYQNRELAVCRIEK